MPIANFIQSFDMCLHAIIEGYNIIVQPSHNRSSFRYQFWKLIRIVIWWNIVCLRYGNLHGGLGTGLHVRETRTVTAVLYLLPGSLPGHPWMINCPYAEEHVIPCRCYDNVIYTIMYKIYNDNISVARRVIRSGVSPGGEIVPGQWMRPFL